MADQRSDQMYSQIEGSMHELREDVARECDDIISKIEQIMRTELVTFEKLKSISTIGDGFDSHYNE